MKLFTRTRLVLGGWAAVVALVLTFGVALPDSSRAAPPPAPTVSLLSPATGSSAGGTTVTITGTNLTGATAVKFGTATATYTTNSSTTVTATAPAGTVGSVVDVTVTTPGGTSATNAGDKFTYTAAPPPLPGVSGLSPSSGPNGTLVTITGTNLTGATAVSFGTAAAASFAVNNSTTVTAIAPAGTGTVDVTVTALGGTSATNAGDKFTYTAGSAPNQVPSPIGGSWQLNGSASLNSTASPPNLQLTPATNWVAGSAFSPTPVPGVGLSTSFDVFLGGGSGSDGMTFALADASVSKPTALGVNGGGEGFSGITGFALSFDTWQNTGDPASNFVGIATTSSAHQGLTYVATNTTIPALRNAWHHVTLTTNSTGITVTMDGTQVLTYTTTLPPYVLLGFTGATGGFNDLHQAENFYATSAPPLVPTVSAVSPTSGPTVGGGTVTITGTNFTGATAVNFGTNPATTYTVNSDGLITATAPAGTAGTVDVTVATPGGTSATSTADQFTYNAGPPPTPTVTSLSPTNGTTAGGTTVTITGTNFTGATAVNFAANPAAAYTLNSSTSISATAPAGSAGAVDVTVTTPGGTSATNAGDKFTYVIPAPTVSLLSPATGSSAGGTTVTITGTNLTGATAVKFGTATATYTTNSSTTVTATAPAGTVGSVVDVTVTTPGGTSATNAGDKFTYTAAPPPLPGVSGLSPSSGPNGTLVTITGTNLTGATAVSFGTAAAASFAVNNSTTVTAIAPAGTGTVDVTVTALGGTSATNAGDKFTYTAGSAPNQVPSPIGGSWQLNGSASLNSTASPPNLQLTPATNWVAGSAFSPTPVPGVGLSTSFDVFLGGGSGSDGMTFALADASVSKPTALGVNGGGEGFSGITGFALSFDTWQNTGDPASNFVGIATTSSAHQGLTYVATNTTIPALRNAWHHVTLTTNSTGITVTMDGTQVLTYTTTLPPYVLLGFTGATGGFNDLHQAENFYATSAPPLVPTVSAVSPTSGPTVGGGTVTITGTNFTGATAVNFGTNPATTYTVNSDGLITATAPAGTAGTVDVTVATPGGTSATSTADQFTYNAGPPPTPTVTSLSPTNGTTAGGTTVTITGTNFTGATAVNFAANPAAAYTLNSSTSISATAPAGSAGAVDVTVTTPGGTSATNAGDKFTYVIPAPTVSLLSPATGSSAGGTTVTITGTNLTGATAVKFGTATATYTTNSSTTVTATAPAGTVGSVVDVTVTTPGGTSATNAGDKFTYTAAPPPLPGVSGLSPSSGPNGTLVTITGTNLTGATAVSFGTAAAASFAVNNSTTVTAIAPAGTGTVDVTVTALGGTSATNAGDKFTYTAGSAPNQVPSPIGGSWQLNGSASLNSTASPPNLQLTPATNWVAGSAFSPTPVPGVGLSTSFDVFLGGGSGSDGMTFALADASVSKPTALGVNGGGEGFSGITGFALSFDTWQNTGDPASNFVGIATTSSAHQGLTYVATNTTIPALRNAWHHVTLTTNSTGITVTMDGTQVLTYTTTLPPYVLLGFTGATGGFNDLHQAENFYATSAPPLVPTVSAVSPTSGPTVGGGTVTITGTNFTGATAVNFGTNPATTYTVNSDGLITATAPAGTAGTVDVTVATPGGTSATSTADQFTYNAGPPPTPTVTSLSPTNGTTAGGTTVTITGTNFTGATAVNFAANPAAAYTLNSSTSISATAPAGSAGAVDVTVTTPGGTSATNAGDKFTYVIPAPTVSLLSPATGSSAGGTTVTITGTNLTGATAVKFGTATATYTTNSSTTVTATAPAGTVGSVVDVTVTTPGGTSATNAGDKFTYTAAPPPLPGVSGLSPSSGPNGTLVTITGTNLTGATAVSFGTAAAASFAVNNSTTVTAIAPAGTGTVDVTVTALGGTSATNAGDKFTYTAGSAPNQVPSPIGGSWQLNGSASLNSTASPPNLQLTPATNWVAGSAFSPTPVPGVGLSTSFDVFLGGGSGSDGMTFALADASVSKPTALGVNGGGEGFSGITGFALSFDTWQNTGDPASNFVGIATTSSAHQGLTYVATNTTIPALRNAWHHVTLTTNSTGITVTMDGTQVLTYTTTLPPYVLLGFTGATGGFNDLHQAENFYATSGPPAPAPTVTQVDPNDGVSTGGDQVSITGTNFTGATAVNFGTNPATTYTVNSDGLITATAPAGTAGTVDVKVVALGGTSATTNIDQYTYVVPPVPTVTAVAPTSGPSTGGTAVQITGTGFTYATAVNFGNNPATQFQVSNDGSLTATAPAGRNGGVDITVVTSSGTSATNSGDRYTYVTPPVPAVTGITPTSGQSTGGTTVNITGTAFTGTTMVSFGTNNPSETYSVNSATSITATAPRGPIATVDVTVTTPGGTSATSGVDKFTYTAPPAPTVTSLSPSSGANGTLVTVTGTNFTGATAVKFGANAAMNPVFSSGTVIYAAAPPGTGTVDVTVTTPGGTSATSAADRFSYTIPSAPTVTALSPSSGYPSYSVTITGTHFTGASGVSFGGQSASFTVNNDTTISATVPSGSGTIDVTVTTSGGTSPTGSADNFSYLSGTAAPTMVAKYRGDYANTGYYPNETGLTQTNAASLALHWTDKGGGGSYAQPIIANNLIYWGDWNGNEHATTLSGTDMWTTNLGVNTDSACSPSVAGVSGTATAANMGSTPVVYVPGGDDNFYMLNALTGAVIWKTSLGVPPADYLWSSPVLYNGSIYEAVASFGDCPLVPGRVVQMDATTGAITHTTYMVPNGCVGGGIWSSPAVDPNDGSIYVTTGTPNGCHGLAEMAPAIVKMRLSDLSVVSSWTIPQSELYSDPDFGSTPVLFTAVINGAQRQLVAALDKNGIFYAWDENNVGAGPVWETRIANPAGGPLSITSPAWDGSTLYIGGGNTIINGVSCYQNISALDPATGNFIWRNCVQGSMTAGITLVPGVLIEPYGADGRILFLNTSNGAVLNRYSPGGWPQGEVTVSNGIVYVSLTNGNLIALGQ